MNKFLLLSLFTFVNSYGAELGDGIPEHLKEPVNKILVDRQYISQETDTALAWYNDDDAKSVKFLYKKLKNELSYKQTKWRSQNCYNDWNAFSTDQLMQAERDFCKAINYLIVFNKQVLKKLKKKKQKLQDS